MKKLLILFVGLFLVSGIGYLIYHRLLVQNKSEGKAVLSVNAPFSDAGVFIDDVYLGPTPYFSDSLSSGEVSLRVGDWVGKVVLTPGALTVVNQDLGPDGFSGGEIIWLTETQGETGLAIISSLGGVNVSVDGNTLGETPLKISTLDEGEHQLVLSKEGYLERSLTVRLQDNYTVNVNVELFLKPLAQEIKEHSLSTERVTLFDFSLEEEKVNSDMVAWLKGLVFYFKSYAFDSPYKPDYYLFSDGVLYASNGEVLTVERYPPKNSAPFVLAYLSSSEKGLSELALSTLGTLSSSAEVLTPSSVGKKGRVLETGTGWLRVRSGAGLTNPEIGRVNVGDELDILREQEGWVELKLKDETSGWVSSQFLEKIN